MTRSLLETSQWKWSLLRAQILQRDNYLCQPCNKQGKTTPAKEVDHIIPRAKHRLLKGDIDSPDNLQAICHECHTDKTQREQGKGRKVSSACDVNGYPLSKQHYWNKT